MDDDADVDKLYINAHDIQYYTDHFIANGMTTSTFINIEQVILQGIGIADTFVFTSDAVNDGVAKEIVNFTLEDDKIDLTQVISSSSQYQLVQAGANTNLQVDLQDGQGFQTLVVLENILHTDVQASNIIV